MPCSSALCLSSILVYWPPPFPPLPEINGRCEQNRTVSRENAPQENICQSFRAESNRRPILRCRPLPAPFKLAKLLDPNKTLEPFCQTASYFHGLGQNQFGRADHCQLPLSMLGPAAFSGGWRSVSENLKKTFSPSRSLFFSMYEKEKYLFIYKSLFDVVGCCPSLLQV